MTLFELVDDVPDPDSDPELMDSVDLDEELRRCGFVDDPEQELWWLPHPLKEDEAVAVVHYKRLHEEDQERLLRVMHDAMKRRELVMRNENIKQAEAESKNITRRVY